MRLTTHRARRLAKRRAMRRWRERHPIMAAWHCHKWNAKSRKIPVEWTYAEFFDWCLRTDYHHKRKQGFQIHREGDEGAYCLARCTCVPQRENRRMQWVYAKIRKSQERSRLLARTG